MTLTMCICVHLSIVSYKSKISSNPEPKHCSLKHECLTLFGFPSSSTDLSTIDRPHKDPKRLFVILAFVKYVKVKGSDRQCLVVELRMQ